jgi:hypothetical protein
MTKNPTAEQVVKTALKCINEEQYLIPASDKTGNIPSVKLITTTLRAQGYSNTQAKNDIMDNSFDAFEKNCTKKPIIHIDYDFPTNGNGFDDTNYILIADNGGGFGDLETLKEGMRLGSESKTNEENLMGCFGVGLKAAAISMGRLLVVITRVKRSPDAESECMYTAIMDLDRAEESRSWNFIYIRPSTPDEIEVVLTYKSDTVVIISKLDRMKTKDVKNFKQKIIKSSGEVFQYLLSVEEGKKKLGDDGKAIVIINKTTILRPIDSMCRDIEGTELLNEGDKATDFLFEFKGVQLKLKWYYIPDVPDEDANESRVPSLRNQGIFVFRNNRLITSREWFGVMPKHPKLNHCRAELFFDPADDDIMGTDSTKTQIFATSDIPDELYTKFYQDISTYGKRSMEIFEKTANKQKADQEKLKKDNVDNIIEDKINKNPLVPTLPSDEFKLPVVPVDKPEPDPNKKKRIGRPKKHQNKNIEISYVDGHERDRFFTEIPCGKKKWKVEININHPFHKYFKELNSVGQEMVINLLYTLILSSYDVLYNKLEDLKEGTREIPKQAVIDKLFEVWSDDVREIIKAINT